MHLTTEERAMLAGDLGPGVKRAMEIIVALGRIYEAEGLVPIASAQVAGVSYKNLGDAGLEFLQEWAREGVRVRVPTTLNPAGMDLTNWRELGIPEGFARKQRAVIQAFEAMGITPTCTCTPYLVGNAPKLGEHIAWSESSAVSFANSILGARTNREGGPSALAAAITGRTANYGLHLDENRQARYIIDVRCPVESEADFGALGYMVGWRVKNAVPYLKLKGIGGEKGKLMETQGRLRALGAAMAASGAVALYHVEGVAPEARAGKVASPDAEVMVIESPEEGYAALNSPAEQIDLVSIGCPHASLSEIEEVARWLEGKRVKAALWVTTARRTKELAEERGFVGAIEAAGGKVLADMCLVVAPIEELGFYNASARSPYSRISSEHKGREQTRYHTLATNSAKMALYAPRHCGLAVRFGTLEQCLKAAVTGIFH